MKGLIPRITLLGSNSGRNLGDAAILASALSSLSKELPDAEFYVPSSNPSFVERNYGKKYNVHGVSIMPWTMSVRLVGLTTFRAIAKSDAALICDGIIFGRKLWNPFFNWLNNLIFLVPWCKFTRCRLALFSCGIGPFPSKLSAAMARYVMNNADLVILREHDSRKLAEDTGVTTPIIVTGDAAFINEVSSDDVAQQILAEEGIPSDKPFLGINVNTYFDVWLSKSERKCGRSEFLKMIADGVKEAAFRLGSPFTPLLFSTHPMDESTVDELAALLDARSIKNSRYLSHDIQAVMRRCGLFMGMRFHSLVLSSAVGVPITGLAYMPKVRGYMRLLDCEELSIELGSVTKESIAETVESAWANRDQIREKQQKTVAELKEGARRAAQLVREKFFPENLRDCHARRA